MKKGGLYSFFSPKSTTIQKPIQDENKKIDFNLLDEEKTVIKSVDEEAIAFKPLKRRRILEVDDETEIKAKNILDLSNADTSFNSSPKTVPKSKKVNLNLSCDSDNTSERKVVNFKQFEFSSSANVSTSVIDADLGSKAAGVDACQLEDQEYFHTKLQFLKDGFRRDKNGHLHTHPDYDPTTLLLPTGFLSSKEITPAMKQWWKIKSENFDTVLFFKMGKFYETFHMDSDLTVKELGLVHMKGKYAHSGFPETSFAVHASALVEKGYKVARVEQTERPSDVSIRVKETGVSNAEEKLVRRDLCAIMSSGTRIFDSFDFEVTAESCSNKNIVGFGILLSVVEDTSLSQKSSSVRLGICALDSSTAQFKLAEFSDDKTLSRLRTMLAEYPIPVAEVIIAKGSLSSYTLNQLIKITTSARKELISVLYPAQRTIKELLAGSYFQEDLYKTVTDGVEKQPSNADSPTLKFPDSLKEILDHHAESNEYQYALSALGNCLHVLKRHLIDERIISMGRFIKYEPIDMFSSNESIHKGRLPSANLNRMVIDGNAMRNLDIMVNSEGISNKNGTVLGLLNQCSTPFGRRLMSSIVCHPLYKKNDIDDRLDAIDELIGLGISEISEIRQKLSEIPDLERLVFRLHASGNLHYSADHPQNKAILFNELFFNKRKVDDLIATVNGFDKSFSVFILLRDQKFNSTVLNTLLNSEEYLKSSEFENLMEIKEFFNNFKESFNIKKAKSDAVVVPQLGVIPEYDSSVEKIKQIEHELDSYLDVLRKELKCQDMKYWGTGRSRYLLEIPNSCDKIPNKFELKSQRKGFRRYSCAKVQDMLAALILAEENRDSALRSVFALLVKRLVVHKTALLNFIQQFGMIDCLISLAFFSMGSVTNGQLCRPIISDSDIPHINLKGSYHLCLSTVNPNLVSNDLSFGESDDKYSTTLLITGPNMGGKSTLMRQVAITVILAQIGCYVPATYCSLTPVDRIFARLGASFDHPNLGESTFYVELSETSTMINFATNRSLILLDELGRGTATHDGLSIAYSVLKYITTTIKCLTLFSTHYHFMAKEIEREVNMGVKMIYMKCLVDESKEASEDISHITFLYKIAYGVCPKSYGFHVAALAGIPRNIISRGIEMAKKLERNSLIKELLRDTSNHSSMLDICRRLIKI